MAGDTPRILGIEQFAKERRLTAPSALSGVIHAGLMGTPEGGASRSRYLLAIEQTRAAVDATRKLYGEAIERGEVVPPPERTAHEIAAGHPDLPSTQAARRVLAKHQAKHRAATLGGSR